ncbi:LysR family transcriptional regulator [Humitalea sp. 24SJ18S-53]|uniref:LysR family transcriptional regulator n=1 Tax=Humitalea sp. 24SJ18S-53 TaxID=3422307 RepID=UPI003D668653
MNLRQLEIIHAVLRTGSVTDAARALRISQPAVSIALRQYEDRLGARLFERRKGRLVPTAEARELFPDVEDIFDRLGIVHRKLQDIVSGQSGSLCIVSTAAILSSDLAEAIARYRENWPGVRIEIRRMTTTQVIERVARGDAELGLAHLEAREEELAAERLADIQVVCALPAGNPLAARRVVHLRDLAVLPLITYGPDSNIGVPVRRAFAALGLTIRDEVTINDAPTGLQLVQVGVGVALVGHLASCAVAMAGVEIRPIWPAIPVPVLLLTRQDRPVSRNAQRMVDLLRRIRAPSAELAVEAAASLG